MALAQKQSNITSHESMELVQCLLRVSISHTTYLRGIFPDKCYTSREILDGFHVKTFMKGCKETQPIVEWVEHGVFDALRQRYLKTMTFSIAANMEGTELLEEYEFSFCYSKEGDIGVHFNAANTHKSPKGLDLKPDATVDTVKYEIQRLIRMLVEVCQTLEKLPNDRFLRIQLMYVDGTPEEYEPPHFAPADPEPHHFAHKPFSMPLGTVRTNHHGVRLGVRSLMDSCPLHEGEEPQVQVGLDGKPTLVMANHRQPAQSAEGMGEQMSGLQDMSDDDGMQVLDLPRKGASSPAASLGPHNPQQQQGGASQDTGSLSVNCRHGGGAKPRNAAAAARRRAAAAAAAAAAATAAAEPGMVVDAGQQQQLERLRSYCQGRSTIDFIDMLAYMDDVPVDELQRLVDRLEADGSLQALPGAGSQAAGGGGYRVTLSARHQDVTAAMRGLSVRNQGVATPPCAGLERRAFPTGQHTPRSMADTDKGGVQMAAGSENTVSRCAPIMGNGGRRPMQDITDRLQQQQLTPDNLQGVFFETQGSEQAGGVDGNAEQQEQPSRKRRHASTVMAPIHQVTTKRVAKRRGAGAKAAAAAIAELTEQVAPATTRAARAGRLARMAA